MTKKDIAVKMSKRDFTKEHKHLLKVLTKGSRASQVKEAKDQRKEMQKYA